VVVEDGQWMATPFEKCREMALEVHLQQVVRLLVLEAADGAVKVPLARNNESFSVEDVRDCRLGRQYGIPLSLEVSPNLSAAPGWVGLADSNHGVVLDLRGLLG
jgi:hypothetical protein